MTMGFQDNPNNILGSNTANNQFDSSSVTSNADGSMIERIEFLQGLVAAVTSGQVILKGAADAATDSTTIVPILALAGYGDDFFNNQWYLQVLHNDNSAGNAPEKETRKITDYTSATGSFTCDAFSQKVEASDLCVILHESQVAIGSNNNNNVFDSSSVVANASGSMLERLQSIQDKVGAVDASDNIIGANDADNGFDSSAVVANADGSLVERVEYIQGQATAIQADMGNPSARTNFQTVEAMIGIPDAANSNVDDMLRTGFDSTTIAANEDGSTMERLEQLQEVINKGAGTAIAANKSLVDALGTDGNTAAAATAATAVSVLGAIGTNEADVATPFTSAAVEANADGTVLEREEYIQAALAAVQTDLGDPSARANLQSILAMLGNPDVAAQSLWNAIAVAGGIATYPVAAVPGNGAALAQVLRDIWDSLRNGTGGSEPKTNRSIIDEVRGSALNYNALNYLAVTVDLESAAWNEVATQTVFAITGLCRLRILIECTESCTSADAGGTMKLGYTGATDGILGATSIDAFAAGELWIDTSPTEQYGTFAATVFDRVSNGIDIGFEIETKAGTDGTIVFHCWWEPLNGTGAVAAGTGQALA